MKFLTYYDGPKVDIVSILGRLSENGMCLVTGSKENLTYMPVDMNVKNVLFSNMACVNVDIATSSQYCIGYKKNFGDFTIEFSTPPAFEDFNSCLVDALVSLSSSFDLNSHKSCIEIYDLFATHHGKGIQSVSNSKYSINSLQLSLALSLHLSKSMERKSSIII